MSIEASIRTFKRVLFLIDLAVGVLAGVLAGWLAAGSVLGPWDRLTGGHPLAGLAGYGVAWAASLAATGVYRRHRFLGLRDESRRTGLAVLLLALVSLSLLYFLPHGVRPDNPFLIALFSMQFAAAMAGRAVMRQIIGVLRRSGFNRCHVLVVGSGEVAEEFASQVLAHPEWGVDLVGFLNGKDTQDVLGYPVLGPVDALLETLQQEVVDEVVIALPGSSLAQLGALVAICEEQGKVVHLAAGAVIPTRFATRRVGEIAEIPVVSFMPSPTEAVQLACKRLMDMAGALAALILLSPLLAVIAVAVKLDSRGPVFFVQERVGLQGRRFRMYKFRSMVVDAETRLRELVTRNEMSGPVFKMRSDPRVTRMGRFLRRASLDELPQFLNVLKGEMSLVGPRPPLLREVVRYDARQRRRLSVKPGLTCLWQVSGRNDIPFERWVELDLEYIDRWSLWLDLKIMLRTMPQVLGLRGV